MNYCNACGSKVELRIPDDDNRPRHVCMDCNLIHYENPKIVAGAIPVYGDQVLLCRRAIEPCYGLWTVPAGFMENNETVAEAAQRETQEEANARLTNMELYTVISLPHIDQVYMLFRGEMLECKFSPGIESLETRMFTENDIPWDELAFPTVTQSLKHFFQDRKKGHFETRNITIRVN